MIKKGRIVISHSHNDDEAIAEVRSEIKRRGLNQDDVKIRKTETGIIVEAKRDLDK